MNHKKSKNLPARALRAGGQSGFSLVEVIVSILVILVLFELFIIELNALRVSQKQRFDNIAYHIASKKMESLRGTSFDSLPTSGSISDTQLTLIPSGTGTFTISDFAGFSGLKEFVVTVEWNDGTNKSVVLKTLAGPSGLNPH